MAEIKFDLSKALSKGVFTMFKLDGKDQFLLVIKTDGKDPVLITYIKDIAYVPETVDITIYPRYAQMIDTLAQKKVYKGMYKPTVVRATAPEHSMVITSFMQPDGNCIQSKSAEEAAKAAGYTIVEHETVSFDKRDFTEQLKDPEAQKLYENNHTKLVKLNAKYEDLDGRLKQAYEKIESGSALAAILVGPTGSGKTIAGRIIADKLKAPMRVVPITDGITEDQLMGHYIPDGSGNFVFVMGPALKAYTEGGVFLAEEANNAQPSVFSIFNSMLDDHDFITYDGILYKRHPNFVAIYTMNPGYQGTQKLNKSLKGRCSIVNVPAISKEEFIKRSMAYSKMLGHELSHEFYNKLFDFAGTIEKEGNSSKWHEDITFSIRNANRLTESILLKARTLKEFSDAVAIEYLDCLSCDNDNSDKLVQFENSKEVQEMIKNLYDSYDFCAIKKVNVDIELDDLFEEIVESDEHKAKKEEAIDDLFAKLG